MINLEVVTDCGEEKNYITVDNRWMDTGDKNSEFPCLYYAIEGIKSLQCEVKALNLDVGLLKIHSEHQAVFLESCETALAERDENNSALQQQNTALQQQVKDLQAETGNIKAQGIKEACQYFKENSWDFGNYVVSVRDLKDYANTLSSKGGD